MMILKQILAAAIGFSTGAIISGGVFAFIAIIGIVPRLAEKTKTVNHIKLYEEAIIFGGIFGAISIFEWVKVPLNMFFAAFLFFCGGVFIGVLTMSLAEVLDVIPIITRRMKIKQGLFYFVLAIAIGKLIGTLFYFIVPGFYEFS